MQEVLFYLLLLLMGAFLCAWLFGSVGLALANSSLSRLKFNERMRIANESMQARYLS